MANGFILNLYELDLSPLGERRAELPIRLGRSSLNDVAVSHRLVSEFHARIEEVDGQICVRDLSSKNGVFVEAVGNEVATRIEAQRPIDLEPYGFEFLLSPLLRVRLRPARAEDLAPARQSQARGSVLGNVSLLGSAGSELSEDKLTDFHVPEGPPRGVPAAAAAPAAHAPVSPGATARGASSNAPAFGSPAPAAGRPTALQGGVQARPRANAGPPSASPAVQAYASVFIEPRSAPLELPHVLESSPGAVARPHVPLEAARTRVSQRQPARSSTLLEPRASDDAAPHLTRTAWEAAPATLPASVAAEPAERGSTLPRPSLEALALRGLRELAASLLPGQPVEHAGDVVQLITKLHDAVEMFCRCFIPVREACSRFIPAEELERAAMGRSSHRSSAYLAIERALEPRAVAAALIDWRNDAQDAPTAVENILADLMLHHLALSQGVMDGTHVLLDELSPSRVEIESGHTPSVLARLGLASGRERALWEAYVERHAEFDAGGEAFRDAFGTEFMQAYEAHWRQRGGESPTG